MSKPRDCVVFCSMYTQAMARARELYLCTELPVRTLHALLKEQALLTAAVQYSHRGGERLFLILKMKFGGISNKCNKSGQLLD